jgi:hypothetical protein
LNEQFEGGDLAHTSADNDLSQPANKRFDPDDASAGELRRAAGQYFGLTNPQLNQITALEAIAIDPAWSHKAAQILVGIHSSWGGANEVNLPALAKARLQSLRTGNPNYGKL